MGDKTDNHAIRSQHSLLRDLAPIYSAKQALTNGVGACIIIGACLWFGKVPVFPPLLVVFYSWTMQFIARPSVMTVKAEEADWLEEILAGQNFYEQSQCDGQWRKISAGWSTWPHDHIAVVRQTETPPDVKVFAPRSILLEVGALFEVLPKKAKCRSMQRAGHSPLRRPSRNNHRTPPTRRLQC